MAAQRDRLVGNWQHFHAQLDRLRECVPSDVGQFRGLVEALTILREDVEEAYERASQRSNFDTAVASFRQVQATADLPFVEDSRASPPAETDKIIASVPPRPTQRTSGRRMEEAPPAAGRDGRPALSPADDIGNVSLGLVQTACPSLQKHVPEIFDSWTALRSSGRRLCAAATINTQVWTEAENYLGPDAAIAALAVTVQRADDGQVANPGAYLRRLIQRGRSGQLRISRSLFALAGARGGGVPNHSSGPVAPYRGFPLERINWSGWADLVREHAPKPTPDVESVADAFRSWCRKGNIDLAQPSIEKAFIGFCKKWRRR